MKRPSLPFISIEPRPIEHAHPGAPGSSLATLRRQIEAARRARDPWEGRGEPPTFTPGAAPAAPFSPSGPWKGIA